MHVWRLPLLHFAALLALVTVVIAWETLSWFRRRSNSEVTRGFLVAAEVLAALSSPLIVHAIVDPELRDLASRGVYVHHGRAFYLGPGLAAAILFGLSRWAVPQRAPRAGLARMVFWLTAVALITMNLANWCSPGWCERFGFPFSYSWWSDAILVMNGVNLTAGTSILAIVANVLILLGVAVLAARACAAAPSNSAPDVTG